MPTGSLDPMNPAGQAANQPENWLGTAWLAHHHKTAYSLY